MNYDVIKLTPNDLDYIYEQLSANGRELFNSSMLEHIPLPNITLEYVMDKYYTGFYSETYEFRWKDDRKESATLDVKVNLDVDSIANRTPIEFTVLIFVGDDGIVRFGNHPIYSQSCSKENVDFLETRYSDDLVKDKETWQSFPARFLNVNRFLEAMTPELVCDTKVRATREAPKTPHRKKKSKKPNKVKVYRVYSLKKDWRTIVKEHRKNLITCTAWGVRGHYRRYSDGRKIWVNAYIKGKNRDEYKGKEYQLINRLK